MPDIYLLYLARLSQPAPGLAAAVPAARQRSDLAELMDHLLIGPALD